jgi:RNA polymerase sigma factor (sigma-70 family)
MRIAKRSKIKELSDSDLIERYKKSGDKIYVGQLFERYYHMVYGVSLKYLQNEAEGKDATIQIFENLFTDLMKHEVQNFPSWLHTVCRNHCLMFLRKQKRITKHTDEFKREQQLFREEYSGEQSQDKEKVLSYLEEAIVMLKPEQQECIKLFYLNEKCYKEITDLTGYPINKVKSYIQNGKRNLKLILTKNDEIAI